MMKPGENKKMTLQEKLKNHRETDPVSYWAGVVVGITLLVCALAVVVSLIGKLITWIWGL